MVSTFATIDIKLLANVETERYWIEKWLVSFVSEIRSVYDIETCEFRNRDTSGSPKHKKQGRFRCQWAPEKRVT